MGLWRLNHFRLFSLPHYFVLPYCSNRISEMSGTLFFHSGRGYLSICGISREYAGNILKALVIDSTDLYHKPFHC